jgi:hypothetical protein
MNSSIAYLYCCFNHRIMTTELQYVFAFHCTTTLLSHFVISFLIVLFLTSSLSLKMRRGLQRAILSAETYSIKMTCL